LDGAPETLHGTAVALVLPGGPRAALVRGAPGSGKSDLALRCLATAGSPLVPEAVRLVADDRVLVVGHGDRCDVLCPPALRGLIEVRGVGILAVPSLDRAALALVVDLVPAAAVPRLPEAGETVAIAGAAVSLLRLDPFAASAAVKLLMTLRDPASIGRAPNIAEGPPQGRGNA
jgi:serine kinase of HPr protein (carbohydrate metabolism regulator)